VLAAAGGRKEESEEREGLAHPLQLRDCRKIK